MPQASGIKSRDAPTIPDLRPRTRGLALFGQPMLDPLDIEIGGLEFGPVKHPSVKPDRCFHRSNPELSQRLLHPSDRLIAGRCVHNQLADH